jgi:uncharacterized membrane protein YfhO
MDPDFRRKCHLQSGTLKGDGMEKKPSIYNDSSNRQSVWKNCLLAFGVCAAILLLLLYLGGYSPFGEKSLVWADADIQYLDFFQYLKNLISGRDSLNYTFFSLLGSSGYGIFSYYLTSPFNILIVLFSAENLKIFYDLLVLLKISTAAAFMAYFLQKRFGQKISLRFLLVLSLSYALGQYSMAQSGNIMWLDGVYMLPLILLGVYYGVTKQRYLLLSICAGLSIIFNWYTGAINCMFAFFWFVMEYFLADKKEKISGFCRDLGGWIFAMARAVLLSAAVFLPAVYVLRQGKGGSFDFELFNLDFSGSIVSALQNYSLGTISSKSTVSLFCGSIVLLGVIAFFLQKGNIRKKKILGCMLGFALLVCFWNPLILLFSLLKKVDSYWVRYSYISIFALVFIAAEFYSQKRQERKETPYFLYAFCFGTLLLILQYVHPVTNDGTLYLSAFLLLCTGMLLQAQRSRISAFLAAALCGFELFCNGSLLWQYYSYADSQYADYVSQGASQIEEIQKQDGSLYRIAQTSTRRMSQQGTSANFNESLAFGYMSNTGYTSTNLAESMQFLENIGYKSHGEIIAVVNTSIVAADSLLGVKYVLSSYPVNGLQETDLPSYNGKNVYLNPYALPLAFTYSVQDADVYAPQISGNPFEYLNSVYSQLAGREAEIFVPLDYSVEAGDTIVWTVSVPQGEYGIYGNIPTNRDLSTLIETSDRSLSYSKWLSPSVFYIPADGSQESVQVVMESSEYDAVADEQFYALDLSLLKEVSEEISARAASLSISGSSASLKVNASSGQNLFFSIAYDPNWKITVNGKKVESSAFDGALLSIPLEEGENVIEMRYHSKGVISGIILTLLGILLCIFPYIWKRFRKAKEQRPASASK